MEEEKELEKITVNYSQQVALLLDLLKGYCHTLSENKDEYYIIGYDFQSTEVFVHGVVVLGDQEQKDIKILDIHSSPMTLIIEDESEVSIEEATENINQKYSLALSSSKIKYEFEGDK